MQNQTPKCKGSFTRTSYFALSLQDYKPYNKFIFSKMHQLNAKLGPEIGHVINP